MKKGSKHTEAVKKKIAAAMKGNKHPEKWTEKLVIDILKEMIAMLGVELVEVVENKTEQSTGGKFNIKKDIEKKSTRKTHLKIDLLINMGIGNRNWFSEMKAKFAHKEKDGVENPNYSDGVSCMLEMIDMILESNTYNDAFAGKGVHAIAAMNLAKYWGYSTSKVDTTINQKSKVEVELPEVSDEIKEAFERVIKNTGGNE